MVISNEEILLPVYQQLKDKLDNNDFCIDKSGVKTVELINCNIKGLNPEQKILEFNGRKTPLKYVEKESRWYNSQDLNIKGWVDDVEIWKQVCDKHGYVNSNYGWCIYSAENHKQYLNSLESLINNKDTRQAMMIYTRPSMHYDSKRDSMSDFICTPYTHQFIRNDKLKYIVYQRSCDMIFGLFNDLAWHQEVYMKLYNDLLSHYPNLKVGDIDINLGSAHIYERHFSMLEKIVQK